MNDSREVGQLHYGGLCPRCANVQVITSAKGSTFLLCRLSATDSRFSRYPPQPVVVCEGFQRASQACERGPYNQKDAQD